MVVEEEKLVDFPSLLVFGENIQFGHCLVIKMTEEEYFKLSFVADKVCGGSFRDFFVDFFCGSTFSTFEKIFGGDDDENDA